jgi:N-acetylmuramic acid 6-phosphate (MurNAc-6-P) etherase
LAAVKKAGNQVPVALVMLKAAVSKKDAMRRLKKAGGNLRRAIVGTD